MKTIEELIEPKTAAQYLEDMFTKADDLDIPARDWPEGSWLLTILTLLCWALAALSSLRVAYARSGFLGLARGDWLTVLAFYMYGVTRRAATFAQGTIELTNAGAQTHLWAIGDLHFAHDVTGATYTIQAAELVGLGPGQTKTYTILADVAGAGSSAVAFSVTTMVTPLLGVTAANPAAFFGAEEEGDQSLTTRCQAKMAAVSPNGPKDAYVYVARSNDDRFGALPTSPIERVKTYIDPVTDTHYVLIANAGGDVDAPDVELVQDRIDRWASPNANNAEVRSALVNVYLIDAVVTVLPNTLTDAEVENAAALEIASYFKTVPIGGYQEVYAPTSPGFLAGQQIAGQFYEAMRDIVIRVNITAVRVDGVLQPGPDYAVPFDAVPVLASLDVTVVTGFA